MTPRAFPQSEAWRARCEAIDRDSVSRIGLLRALVRRAPEYRGLILDGSIGIGNLYVDLLAGIAVRRRPGGGRVPIVLGECQWKAGGNRLDRTAIRFGLRALDGPKVAYCVLTEWERDRFAGTWGVDPDRVFVTPYRYTLAEEELAAPRSSGAGVFAGGNSLRDYGPLVAAARELDEPVVLATTLVSGPVPPNVTAGPVPPERFVELLRNARVVVVALDERDDRTAGQQTYLNAMALGKPTIVTDSPGVREYVEDGRTGLVVPPADPVALGGALRWALDPRNEPALQRMGAEAEQSALANFSPARYAQRTLDVADRIS